jgi:hypothetical protein
MLANLHYARPCIWVPSQAAGSLAPISVEPQRNIKDSNIVPAICISPHHQIASLGVQHYSTHMARLTPRNINYADQTFGEMRRVVE